MLARILGWIMGYVKIRIKRGAEPLLNLALQSGINIYDVIWRSDEIVEAKVYYKQLGELRYLARKSKSSFRIIYGRGFHFSLKYMKKRIMLPIGFLVFLVGLYILSGFVFFVGVDSKEELVTLKPEEVKLVARDNGVYPGARINEAEFNSKEKAIKKDLPDIAWINITREGTMVHIHVAEKTVLSPEEKADTVGPIFADKDCLIEEVLIMKGKAKVAVGDTVTKGQLLVFPMPDGTSDAIIKARVWYAGFGECATKEAVTQNSGKIVDKYYLTAGKEDKRILLFGYNKYDKEANYKMNLVNTQLDSLYLWRNILLPVEITKLSYQPTYTYYKERSAEEAKKEALDRAKAVGQKNIPTDAKILKETSKLLAASNGIYQVQVTWECLEKIGVRSTLDE